MQPEVNNDVVKIRLIAVGLDDESLEVVRDNRLRQAAQKTQCFGDAVDMYCPPKTQKAASKGAA